MDNTTVKIYDSILDLIDKEITYHGLSKHVSEENKHYFIQGLIIAKQIIEQEQDFVYSDYAYEKFEEVVESFLDDQVNVSNCLYPEDIEKIVEEQLSEIYED